MTRLINSLLAFALLSVTSAMAQQTSIVGVVLADDTGLPIQGAVLEAAAFGVRTVSDADGRFRLAVPSGTPVVLRVQAIGYTAFERRVRPGNRTMIRLERTSYRLPPIEVFRDRTEIARLGDRTPGSAHVITGEDVRRRSGAYQDVHEVLRTVPGVVVQDEEGFGLRPNIGMRGSGSERSARVTVMEDGVLIAPAPYAAPAAYYFPVVGRMEAIEVRKGSSQIKYGPRTIGGAINLVSGFIPTHLKASAEAVGGGHATRRISGRVGGTHGQVGWLVEAFQLESDGFKSVDDGSPAGFQLENYVGKVRWQTPAEASVFQAVELKFGVYDQRSDETYLGVTPGDFGVAPNRRYAASQEDVMNAEHEQFQVRHFLRAGEHIDVTTTAYRNNFSRNWYKLQSVLGTGIATVLNDPDGHAAELAVLRGATSPAEALRLRANNRSYYGQGVQTVIAAGPRTGSIQHALQFGLRYHEDAEDRLQHEDAYRMVAGRMVADAPGAPGSQSNRVSTARAWSGFVEDQVALGPLTVTPGARFERMTFERADYATDSPARTSPVRTRTATVVATVLGAGAMWRVSDQLRLIGGVHQGFAPPGPGADDQTQPERSMNYEVGARVRFGEAALEFIGFYNDYDNILGAATLSSGGDGGGDLFNGGAVRAVGIEMMALARPAFGRLQVPVSVTVTGTSATFRSAFESEYEPWGTVSVGDHLPYQPNWQASASVGLETDRAWRAEVMARYTGPMRTTAGTGAAPNARINGALLLNGSVDYEFAPGVTLLLSGQNLLNRVYVAARRPAGLRPGLPRTLMGGIRFQN